MPKVAKQERAKESEVAQVGSLAIKIIIATPSADNAEDLLRANSANKPRIAMTAARKQESGNPTNIK